MGMDTRRPPLPAPTEDPSSMDNESALGNDFATDISRRTDKTSYSIPENGSPITISTHKLSPSKEGALANGRQSSHTSLLIEYFEAGKRGDKTRSRPSVRVKVTPSAGRKSKTGSDALQITGIGKDRKPSYTRRISLGNKAEASTGLEGTEVSRSTGSNVSARPPVEIEVLNLNGSDMSNSRNSRDLRYLQNNSEISSMPPDSLLDTTGTAGNSIETGAATIAPQRRSRSRSRSPDRQDDVTITDRLDAPERSRNRSLSRERITQKVMEKLAAKPAESGFKRIRNRQGNVEYEPDTKPSKERRRRSSRTYKDEEVISPESSLLSSNVTQSHASYRSGNSKVSLNNPKLLEMVEDTVRRLILPEINQLKSEKRVSHNKSDFEDSYRTSTSNRDSYGEELGRRLSKSSSTPNISSKPKVVLNRHGDNPGEVLSRGDSERIKHRRSSRESVPTSRRSSKGTLLEEERISKHNEKDGHRLRDAAAGGIAGGILTAAALRHHDKRGEDDREHSTKRNKNRDSRSRSNSLAETTEEAYGDGYGSSAPIDRERERSESRDEAKYSHVPPMPFGGGVNDSELTRDSILSEATERAGDYNASGLETPIREVSRRQMGETISPSTVTPTRTPLTARNLGSGSSNRSYHEVSEQSPESARSISGKARLAGLVAAGLGGAAAIHHHHNHTERDAVSSGAEFGSPLSHRNVSPIHSVSSMKDDPRDPLIPPALRPRSIASLASLSADYKQNLHASAQSPVVSPNAPTMDQQRHSLNTESGASFAERSRRSELRPEHTTARSVSPSQPEDVEEWFRRQHEENERYRQSLDDPSSQDFTSANRLSQHTDDDFDSSNVDRVPQGQDVRHVAGANPEYIHTPLAVESAVASLLGPSMISSVMSSEGSANNIQSDHNQTRMADSMRDIGHSPAPHELEVVRTQESSPSSKDRWSALRENALNLSKPDSREQTASRSPVQSVPRSLREEQPMRVSTPVKLGASGMPLADDPMPEIGHGLDDVSEVDTNPPDIQGHVGREPGKDRWSGASLSSSKLDRILEERDRHVARKEHSGEAALLGAAAGAGGAIAAERLLSGHNRGPSQHSTSQRSESQQSVAHRASLDEVYENERGLTPDVRQAQRVEIKKNTSPTSPGAYGDEGYASAAYARSNGGHTPKQTSFDRGDLAAYNAMMENEEDQADEDPFTSAKRSRHLSANSHGVADPLYDSATGKGIDRIQSQDVVALMDHLTVRDAQRNARDTEILVTLVRSAAEMRTSFEEMKKFIAEQDRMIMKNTDRDAEFTVQKVLSGPRPQPQNSRQTSRESHEEEDAPTKRRNVFKRALRGLGGRNPQDLAKIEDMLNQLLDDMEVLKDGQAGGHRPTLSPQTTSRDASLSSYERLRAAPDPGYEPEGQAGTSSSIDVTGQSPLSPNARDKQMFHSGYDGRRGSINRVSTVMEGDEDEDLGDELGPDEANILDQQYDDGDRYLSPIKQALRNPHSGTPPRHGPANGERSADNTSDKQRKHKSSSSSYFGGIPKLSRWSKTTASSAPDYAYDGRRDSLEQKARSEASRSGDSLMKKGAFYDDDYSLQSDDRLRSTQSLAREQEATERAQMDTRSLRSGHSSQFTRTPSPLIPDGASSVASRSIREPVAAPSPKLMLPGDDEMDDPKYQANRNSLLLQHPQPRPGPTHRHQSNLEDKAHAFDGPEFGTDSDLSQRTADSDFDPLQWGSNPALSLARTNKLGNVNANNSSPYQSPTSATFGASKKQKDDGPLFPPAQQSSQQQHQYGGSSSGASQPYSSRAYYSSPLGSGHLLEPIEEVSTIASGTDSRNRTPEPTAQPPKAALTPASAGNRQSSARKITGPRPMGGSSTRSPKGANDSSGLTGTVRRKPVASDSMESFDSD